jgi:hypothetical protein
MSTIVEIIKVEAIPGMAAEYSYVIKVIEDCLHLARERHAWVDITINNVDLRIAGGRIVQDILDDYLAQLTELQCRERIAERDEAQHLEDMRV